MRRRAHVKVAEKLERLDSGILGGRGDQKKSCPEDGYDSWKSPPLVEKERFEIATSEYPVGQVSRIVLEISLRPQGSGPPRTQGAGTGGLKTRKSKSPGPESHPPVSLTLP